MAKLCLCVLACVVVGCFGGLLPSLPNLDPSALTGMLPAGISLPGLPEIPKDVKIPKDVCKNPDSFDDFKHNLVCSPEHSAASIAYQVAKLACAVTTIRVRKI